MVYGIMLSILASLGIAFSMYLQKKGLNNMDGFRLKGIMKSPMWFAGTLLGLSSVGVYLFALTLERVSIVQPLVDTSVVFAIVISHLFMDDDIARNEILSVGIIFTGIVLLVV